MADADTDGRDVDAISAAPGGFDEPFERTRQVRETGSSVMARAELEYVSAGCNRSVHAAAWNRERGPGGGLVAYGTHSTVAVYDPAAARVVRTVGKAHDAPVTAVSWLESDDDASAAADGGGRGLWMASGGSDGAVLLWHRVDDPRVSTAHEWVVVARGAHGAPVTDVCALEMRGGGGTRDDASPSPSSSPSSSSACIRDSSGVYLLATASQDCTVRMWRADLAALAPRHPAPPPTASTDPPSDSDPNSDAPHSAFRCVWTTTTQRKATPTSAALAWLPGAGPARVVAAVGCADGNVRLHLCDVSATEHGCVDAEHAATLEGHSDWVRDLAFTEDASDASDANDANAEVDGSNDDGSDRSPGLLLASASQDRTARIWRVSRKDGDEVAKGAGAADATASFAFMRLAAPPKPPSRLLGGGARLATHLEALLQGHDDWVLSAAWRPKNTAVTAGFDQSRKTRRSNPRPELLTASMDRSLILWTPSASGAGELGGGAGGSTVWMADVSLGEAAASCLGFYGAAFDAVGKSVLAHSHGGAFHLWTNAEVDGSNPGGREWTPRAACTGHVADVTCASWDSRGRWLLTGSRDMTTRLHANWNGGVDDVDDCDRGWRQLARPQVHGHAVACVAALPPNECEVDGSNPGRECGSIVFVSGSDEKTLRVFEAPGPFLGTLAKSLGKSGKSRAVAALEAAAVKAGVDAGAELPALGLSNKATRAEGGADIAGSDPIPPPTEDGDENVGSVVPAVLTRPPPEEVLAQATLWPETRKLYGHGNDLAVVAAHHAGRLVASASVAQSAAAAAIWMWAAGEDWRPLGKLPGATLDVVALDFAGPCSGRDCLLAASRDRHVALYAPVNPSSQGLGVWGDAGWTLVARVKASAKALYDAGWAPGDADAFASCGRDRRVRVWNVNRQVAGSIPDVVEEAATLPVFESAVTACRFSPERTTKGGLLSLAAGTEDGSVSVWVGEGATWTIAVRVAAADAHVCAVRAIAWRPDGGSGRGDDDEEDDEGDDGPSDVSGTGGAGLGVATAGADHSVRIYRVMLE